MSKNKSGWMIYGSIAAGVLVLIALIWFARPAAEGIKASAPPVGNGTLVVAGVNYYDFGRVSMAAGKVSYQFKLENPSSDAVMINKIYTSCMCTTASLIVGGRQFGPYGMPGHGFIPAINQTIDPAGEATVEVVFDPAAHGPAGVGQIYRSVVIENNAGEPVELRFAALVTP